MRNHKINLVIPMDIYENMKARKGFIPSQYLSIKYKREFMGPGSIKKEIEQKSNELAELNKRLVGMKEESPVKAKNDPRRCVLCSMFFNEKISFRKKVFYKTYNFCQGCMINRKIEVDAKVELFEKVK